MAPLPGRGADKSPIYFQPLITERTLPASAARLRENGVPWFRVVRQDCSGFLGFFFEKCVYLEFGNTVAFRNHESWKLHVSQRASPLLHQILEAHEKEDLNKNWQVLIGVRSYPARVRGWRVETLHDGKAIGGLGRVYVELQFEISGVIRLFRVPITPALLRSKQANARLIRRPLDLAPEPGNLPPIVSWRPLSVRSYGKNDLNTLIQWESSAQIERLDQSVNTWRAWSNAQLLKFLSESAESFDPNRRLLAVSFEGEIVGFFIIQRHNGIVEIVHFAISPKHRSLGVAQQLLRHTEALLNNTHTAIAISPSTFPENWRPFFETMGFSHSEMAQELEQLFGRRQKGHKPPQLLVKQKPQTPGTSSMAQSQTPTNTLDSESQVIGWPDNPSSNELEAAGTSSWGITFGGSGENTDSSAGEFSQAQYDAPTPKPQGFGWMAEHRQELMELLQQARDELQAENLQPSEGWSEAEWRTEFYKILPPSRVGDLLKKSRPWSDWTLYDLVRAGIRWVRERHQDVGQAEILGYWLKVVDCTQVDSTRARALQALKREIRICISDLAKQSDISDDEAIRRATSFIRQTKPLVKGTAVDEKTLLQTLQARQKGDLVTGPIDEMDTLTDVQAESKKTPIRSGTGSLSALGILSPHQEELPSHLPGVWRYTSPERGNVLEEGVLWVHSHPSSTATYPNIMIESGGPSRRYSVPYNQVMSSLWSAPYVGREVPVLRLLRGEDGVLLQNSNHEYVREPVFLRAWLFVFEPGWETNLYFVLSRPGSNELFLEAPKNVQADFASLELTGAAPQSPALSCSELVRISSALRPTK